MENQNSQRRGREERRKGKEEEKEDGLFRAKGRWIGLTEEEPPPGEIALLVLGDRGQGDQAVTREGRKAPTPSGTEREAHYPNTEGNPVAVWLITVLGGW